MALSPGPACLLGVGCGEVPTLLAASTPPPSLALSLYSLGLSPNRVGLAHLGLSPPFPVVLLWSPRAQRLEPQYLFQLH